MEVEASPDMPPLLEDVGAAEDCDFDPYRPPEFRLVDVVEGGALLRILPVLADIGAAED